MRAANERIARVAPDPVLFSARHASVYLDVAYTTLRDYALRGELPTVKIGKRWYFRKADLDALIATNLDTTWVAEPRPRKAKPQFNAA